MQMGEINGAMLSTPWGLNKHFVAVRCLIGSAMVLHRLLTIIESAVFNRSRPQCFPDCLLGEPSA